MANHSTEFKKILFAICKEWDDLLNNNGPSTHSNINRQCKEIIKKLVIKFYPKASIVMTANLTPLEYMKELLQNIKLIKNETLIKCRCKSRNYQTQNIGSITYKFCSNCIQNGTKYGGKKQRKRYAK